MTGRWPTVDEVVACLSSRRYRYATERQLQDGLEQVLRTDGYAVEREYPLDSFSRLDLLAGAIAVEVKVSGSRDAALRQVRRYVAYERVGGIVLVTSRVRHTALPTFVDGKPVRVVQLALAGL